MKEIRAFVQPRKLTEIAAALHRVVGLTGMTVTEVRGFGREKAKDASERIVYDFVSFVRKIRIEIVCHDELVPQVVSAIESAAHTGLRGDGKIYIAPIDDAVRISSGERGDDAV